MFSMLGKWLFVLLAVTLVSCNSPDQTVKNPTMPGGPGDDDDRPVTMIDGSLDFVWADAKGFEVVDDDTRLYAYSKAANASVNEIDYRLKNSATGAVGRVVFRRKSGSGLKIEVTYGPPANPKLEVQIVTDAEEGTGAKNAPNLKLISPAGASVRMKDYDKPAKYLLKHPKKSNKPGTVTLYGVAVQSQTGTHGCDLSVNPIVCTVNKPATDNDSTMAFSVCIPTATAGSCPPTAP